MRDDGKLRGASKAAKDILGEYGNPQDMGQPYTERQIFETTNELMRAEIQPASASVRYSRTEGIAEQHRNFIAPAYGTDAHARSMDDVDRGANPNIPVLEAEFVGVDNFAPPDAANTSTYSRPPRRSSGTRSGDFSSTGNRHPL